MSPKAFKYGVYAYKICYIIGLEDMCPELAVLIERDTGITQADYSSYELPVSDKSNEILAIIYFLKYANYFSKKGLNDKVEDYFKICDKIVNFVSGKTGIPRHNLVMEADV